MLPAKLSGFTRGFSPTYVAETVAEKRLWQELRTLRTQGYHFRRQHPIEGYIVDFACLTHLLIIEVDGYQHGQGDIPAADATPLDGEDGTRPLTPALSPLGRGEGDHAISESRVRC